MIPIETSETAVNTLIAAPVPLAATVPLAAPTTFVTQAPLEKDAPQTDCDGVGTCKPILSIELGAELTTFPVSCPTGTCYTGLDGFIGCCSVSVILGLRRSR